MRDTQRMTAKLVRIEQLSEMSGLPVRSLRTMMKNRVVPFVRTGHRSVWFQPEKVLRALEKFEVKSVADRNGK